MDAERPAGQWLISRIDQRWTDLVGELLIEVTEQLSLATSDGVTIRELSPDGVWLVAVSSYHPDPSTESAIASVMSRTAHRSAGGLWHTVFQAGRTVKWTVEPGRSPVEASAEQAAFLQEHPVRGILATCISLDDRLLGGISLLRFAPERPFSKSDEDLLEEVAKRVAVLVDCRQRLRQPASR